MSFDLVDAAASAVSLVVILAALAAIAYAGVDQAARHPDDSPGADEAWVDRLAELNAEAAWLPTTPTYMGLPVYASDTVPRGAAMYVSDSWPANPCAEFVLMHPADLHRLLEQHHGTSTTPPTTTTALKES